MHACTLVQSQTYPNFGAHTYGSVGAGQARQGNMRVDRDLRVK